jgi:hypothetical protein
MAETELVGVAGNEDGVDPMRSFCGELACCRSSVLSLVVSGTELAFALPAKGAYEAAPWIVPLSGVVRLGEGAGV